MADELTEVLELDVRAALDAVDELQKRLADTAAATMAALEESIADGIRAGMAALSEVNFAPVDLTVVADTDLAATAIEALGGELAPVDLVVDTSSVTDALDSVSNLTAATDTAATPIDLQVDDSQVTDATAAVGDLVAAEQEASGQQIDIGVTGGDQVGGLDSSVQSLGQSSGQTDALIGGLSARLSSSIPISLQSAAGIGLLAGATGEFVSAGEKSIEGTERMNRAFGDQADAVQHIDIGGLDTDLKSLTISTGSSTSALRLQIANLAETGRATGATRQETVEAGKAYGALANYIAATRPELGTAEQVTQKLNTALRSGGRAAVSLGLPLNSAAEIADAAAAKFAKPVAELTTFEKQSAALDLVLQRLGPSFKKNLDEGLQSPTVQLRAVEAQLKAVIAEAGRGITPKFIDALKDAEPLVAALTKSAGGLATGGVSFLSGAFKVLAPLVESVAKVLGAVPAPLLEIGGGMLVASKAATLLNGPLTSLLTGLANLAERGGATAAAASLRSMAAAETTATVATETATTATEEQVLANEAMVVSTGEATAALEAEAVAATETGAANVGAFRGMGAGAAAAAGDALAAINPLTVALVAVAGAYLLYQQNQEKIQAITDANKDAVEHYTESLDLSGDALGKLDPSKARQAFIGAEDLVSHFRDTLTAQGVDVTIFDQAGVSATELGQALAGSDEAIESTVSKLQQLGQFSESTGDSLKRFATGLLAGSNPTASDALGFTNSGGLSDQATALLANVRAIKEKQKAELEEAHASLAANEITNEGAIQAGLATGAFDKLTLKQRARLGVLIDEKAAALEAAKSEVVLEAAVSALTPAQAKLFDAAEHGDLGAAKALVAADNFATLDPELQKTIKGYLDQADAVNKAAAANDELIDSNGNLTTSMAGLNDQLGQQADRYLALSGATVTVAKAGRDAETAIAAVGQAIADNGPSIDDTGSKFDASTITVENYKAALDALPQSVQTKINAIGTEKGDDGVEGRVNAVRAAWGKLLELNRAPLQLKVGEITAVNVNDVLSKLPADLKDQITIQTKVVAPKAGDTEAAKARATAAAVAGLSGEARKKLDALASDGAAKVVDAFDTAGQSAKQFAVDQIKSGVALDDAKQTLKDYRDQLRDTAVAGFEKLGDSADVAAGKVGLLLLREHLTDKQIDAEIKISGLDAVARQIQILSIALLSLADVIPKDKLDDILGITDATKQADALNSAIHDLPPEKQTVIRAVLGADSVDQAKAGLDTAMNANPTTAIVKAATDPASLSQAQSQIEAVVTAHPEAKIAVNADTTEAVAKLNAATFTRAAQLVAEGRVDEAKKLLDDTAAARTTLIAAATDDASLTNVKGLLDELTKERTVDIQLHFLGSGGSVGGLSHADQEGAGAPSVTQTATPASTPNTSGLFGRALHPGGASVAAPSATPTAPAAGPTPQQRQSAQEAKDQETLAAGINGNPDLARAIQAETLEQWAAIKRYANQPVPGFREGGEPQEGLYRYREPGNPEVVIPESRSKEAQAVPLLQQTAAKFDLAVVPRPQFAEIPAPQFAELPPVTLAPSMLEALGAVHPLSSLGPQLAAPGGLQAAVAGPQELRLAAVEGLLGDLLSELRGSGQALASMSSQRSRGDTTITTHIAQIVAPSPAEVGNAVSRRQGIEARKKATA